MIRDGIADLGGIGEVLASVVTGIVGGLVGAVKTVVGLIGGLFNLGRHDTAAVDNARVAGENAIVARWGEAFDHLDEIQRVGGAWADWPMWGLTWGEDNPHPLPLTTDFNLIQGAVWHPPDYDVWDDYNLDPGYQFVNTNEARGLLARSGGTLELQESGLWMIYFQAALLQGSQRTSTPADLWCYVTDSSTWVPVGTPPASGGMDAYARNTGNKTTSFGASRIAAHGRAGSYLGVSDTRYGGGNTVSGYMLCPLPTANWYVHLSCTGYRHFGGASSTFLFATKVNSETLRQDIDQLKIDIADSLPGQPTEKLLDEDAIAAMVAEAEGIDVLNGEGDE